MARIVILIAILFVSLCQEAKAICLRCRRQVCACKYYTPKYVAPVQAYQAPNVFVVQNNYPQSIGAYAAQGNSVFGVQSAAQAYFINPAEYQRQSAEMIKAAMATTQLGLTGWNQFGQTQLAVQAQISEPLARGHAAAQILAAAGLTSSVQQPLSLALKVSQTPTGQWQVEQVQAAEVNTQIDQKSPVQAPQAEVQTLIGQRCGKCHGLNITEPKGGVFLDTGHKLTCEVAMKALQLVKADKMPKDTPLTNQEKAVFLDELLKLTNVLE